MFIYYDYTVSLLQSTILIALDIAITEIKNIIQEKRILSSLSLNLK